MAKILIFDSGVGGLTIFQEISRQSPYHSLVFASDNAAYPYGTKSEDELIERVCYVVEELFEKYQPDVLVVACNSVSTVVLPILREKMIIPVVGVVPAIKPAAKISKTKSIGVLATPATITRQYTKGLIKQFAADCQVTLLGSSELVDMAEQFIRGNEPNLEQLTAIVSPMLDTSIVPKIDTIVLACTHFPLLKEQLNSVFELNNHMLAWVDSGEAVASRVADVVGQQVEQQASHIAVFTGQLQLQKEFADYLQQLGIKQIEYLDKNI